MTPFNGTISGEANGSFGLMASKEKPETEAKGRKQKSTFDEVVRAAKRVEKRTNKPASEAAVRKELKGGSPNYVCRKLAEWRASKRFDGLKRSRPSDPFARVPERDHQARPYPEPPEVGHRPSSGQEGDGAAAVSKPTQGTADATLEALAARIDKLQALLQRQGVDIKLLGSDVQGLERRVGTLSDVAVTDLRQRKLAKSDAANADLADPDAADSDGVKSDDVTTEPRRRVSMVDVPDRGKAPPSPSTDDDKIRNKIRVAMFHCVAKLVEFGSPMSCKQLYHLLPEDVRVGTSEDLYTYLKIRARKGETIKYAGGRSGAFEAGPDAVAFLDRHQQKPASHLTRTQVARVETEVMFLAALELLEKAEGRPLAVKDFVNALSDGSKESAGKVKMLLKNCYYRHPPRRDERGRGIGKIGDGHVLTRHQGAR